MGLLDGLTKSIGLGGQSAPTTLFAVGDEENQKTVDAYTLRVEKEINVLEDQIEKLSDEELKAKTQEFRNRLKDGVAVDLVQLLHDEFSSV